MNALSAPSWHRDAACLEHPREWWFPDAYSRKMAEQAKAICGQCLVRVECLTSAIERHEDDGIWGGFKFGPGGFKRGRCRRCTERIPAVEVALLAIRDVQRSAWMCRRCWYRTIAERRRT